MKPYYEADGVVIYHGDCREILPALSGVELVLTDPPYGIAYQHGGRAGGVLYGMDGHSIVGDDEPFDPTHLLGVARKVIIWGGNHFASRLPDSRGWLVWNKRDDGPEMDQADLEMAWTSWMTVCRVFTRRWSGSNRGGREQAEGRWHVNQKPVALMQWCMGYAPGARLICDPFMGSGTTLVAAKDLGRQAVGIEIEERYCEIAARRLSQGVLDFGDVA